MHQCHPEHSEGSVAQMLHFVQHDRSVVQHNTSVVQYDRPVIPHDR